MTGTEELDWICTLRKEFIPHQQDAHASSSTPPSSCQSDSKISSVANLSTKPNDRDIPVIISRADSKPPFKLTNICEARGDALGITYSYLIQRHVPVWAAHLLAYKFVELPQVSEALKLQHISWTEGSERISASEWYSNLISELRKFLISICDGTTSVPEKPVNYDKWPFSYTALKHVRPRMEDRNVIIPNWSLIEPSDEKIGKRDGDAFFAVFDGHAGHEVAQYLSSHFQLILNEDQFADEDGAELIRKAFDEVNKRVNNRCTLDTCKSGSTAVGGIIRNDVLHLFWCGDSSAGILSNTAIRTLSTRHNLDNDDELERIASNGGVVIMSPSGPRVNGILNISRALGVVQLKPPITAEPEFLNHQLTPTDYILFFASDGVWDMLSSKEICKLCVTFAQEHEETDYAKLTDYIVTKAKEANSLDNLTLIAVFLQPVPNVWKHLRSSFK